MSTTEASSNTSTGMPEAGTIDMKLEVVTLPVSDVDRAKRFYQSLGGGWMLTSPSATLSGWSSSRPPTRRADCLREERHHR